jgi:hypothetical protein
MKKLIVLLALAAVAYWLVKDRFGGEPDEFIFTEVAPNEPEPAPTT